MSSEEDNWRGYEWTALSVTTIGALLASIQGSALLIALPEILTHLQTDFITIMWVLLGYLLVTTALVPVVGRLADMFGRKRLYNAGFAIFTLGSLLCGLSQPQFHGWDLVGYRLIQGVGGALLFTNSAAIVTDAFRKGRVGLGLGVNQIAFAAGFMLGPVIGGILTAISWQLVFLVNVPLGVAGTIWGILRLREPVLLPARQSFDWPGSLTFTVGLGSLLSAVSLVAFPLINAVYVYALFVCSFIGLGAFFLVERRAAQPMLDFRLFQDKLFSFACAANALNSLARGAVLFVLIFFLQGPYGLDPLWAGIMMAPFGAAFMLIGPVSGYLSDSYGSRGLATTGLLISALGLLGLSTVVSTTPYWLLAFYMALMGGGSGFFGSPNTNAVMSSVVPEKRGTAAGINALLMNTGQMLSIAIAFPLVLSRIPLDVMFQVFLYGGGMHGTSLAIFETGMSQAFLASFVLTLMAAAVSAMRPAHSFGALGG
ncbi:Putative multidrug resistance protein MdtD [uncultured archaeon]|nr:Putative multidrug resistance protein MdtD [uncultured archaeon]